ncbi:MAG: hypothetical protein K6G81_11355 [Lachnospiraceae bacterium]|nr:hypothetical protein [Lachnospiraceae bacterium]
MWDESIRLELLALGVAKAAEGFDRTRDKTEYDAVYLDLRQEFPTLSQKEIWQLIGLCVKLYERGKTV